MQRLRALCAVAAISILACTPAFGNAPPSVAPVGTVIAAERAHIGQASASVGTTIFGGDYLSTDTQGSVQLRTGAARLLLYSSSSAIVNSSEGSPSAKLLSGTAAFSTGNSRAFVLFASTASIRPETDAPTIGQVTRISERELLVTAKRGELVVTVEDETQVVAEGKSYRVFLDPEAAQGPAGAGAGGGPGAQKGGPLKAGRSRFLIVAIGLTGLASWFAISEALESPDRP